jgi:hypothetical protein
VRAGSSGQILVDGRHAARDQILLWQRKYPEPFVMTVHESGPTPCGGPTESVPVDGIPIDVLQEYCPSHSTIRTLPVGSDTRTTIPGTLVYPVTLMLGPTAVNMHEVVRE